MPLGPYGFCKKKEKKFHACVPLISLDDIDSVIQYTVIFLHPILYTSWLEN